MPYKKYIQWKLIIKNLSFLQLLAGAGAVEIELGRQIEEFGEKQSGLQQYAIKKFATALEILPKQLATNAGFKVGIEKYR